MSDTPRTDDVEAYSSVPGDFARTLERELSAAIARAEAAEEAVKHVGKWANIYHDRLEKAEAERDTLRAELDRLKKLPQVPKPWGGCPVCGLGADGKATGYVCQRPDCPTRITCGSAV